jgi:putative membrane protein
LQILPEGTLVETLDRFAGADRSELETVAIVVGTLVLASILISLVSTVLVYWDFTVVRTGDHLVLTRGLLQTRRSVVPVARIQSVRLEENLIRRALGLASLRVLTAGYGRGSGDEQQTSMLVPVSAREHCLAIASTVMGSEYLAGRGLEPAPGPALWLRICGATIVGVAALVIGLIVADGEFFILAIPILPLAIAIAVLAWRSLGHAVLDRHVVARWGGLVRRTALADERNIQHLRLRRSPVQRVFGLASVRFAIPKASTALIDLDREVAEERFEELAARLMGSHVDDPPERGSRRTTRRGRSASDYGRVVRSSRPHGAP